MMWWSCFNVSWFVTDTPPVFYAFATHNMTFRVIWKTLVLVNTASSVGAFLSLVALLFAAPLHPFQDVTNADEIFTKFFVTWLRVYSRDFFSGKLFGSRWIEPMIAARACRWLRPKGIDNALYLACECELMEVRARSTIVSFLEIFRNAIMHGRRTQTVN